jgi:endo-1,4-beta-xylanase
LHVNVNTSAAAVDEALTAVESLGLISHVTELDVSLYTDPGSCYENGTGCQADYGANVPQSVLSAQATLYRQLFNVFRSHVSVRSVSTWGISDNHTWLGTFPVNRTNRPLLFDSGRLPKWAFWAVVDSSIVIP